MKTNLHKMEEGIIGTQESVSMRGTQVNTVTVARYMWTRRDRYCQLLHKSSVVACLHFIIK
jgi:hypothetical protein